MRTVSSSIMAALVVVALFWGNCFSCPQALLALKTHQPAHQCCHKTKSSAPGCEAQSLQHFVKTDPGAQVPTLPVVAAVVAQQPAPSVSASEVLLASVEYAPPDLLSLHSSFRI